MVGAGLLHDHAVRLALRAAARNAGAQTTRSRTLGVGLVLIVHVAQAALERVAREDLHRLGEERADLPAFFDALVLAIVTAVVADSALVRDELAVLVAQRVIAASVRRARIRRGGRRRMLRRARVGLRRARIRRARIGRARIRCATLRPAPAVVVVDAEQTRAPCQA
jgi:hypothetical protein